MNFKDGLFIINTRISGFTQHASFRGAFDAREGVLSWNFGQRSGHCAASDGRVSWSHVIETGSAEAVWRVYCDDEFEIAVRQGASLTSVPCALNGRAIVAATQDQSVRTVDPREHLALTVGVNKAHSHGPCVWSIVDGHIILSRV